MNSISSELPLAIIGFLALWWLWFVGIRPAILDYHRQRIFELRDELFDAAANGLHGLSFESEAYKAHEKRINVSIRYLHLASPIAILISIWCILNKREPYATVLTESIREAQAPCTVDASDPAATFLRGLTSTLFSVEGRHTFLYWPVSFALAVVYAAANHKKLGIPGDLESARAIVVDRERLAFVLQADVESRVPVAAAA